MTTDLYTIGHSTRAFESLLAMLRAAEIMQLVDIRTLPRSRWVPQFDREALERELPPVGIRYRHEPRLGGLRRISGQPSANTGWRNARFRAFADYMDTPEFLRGLEDLIESARETRTAIMCAEAVPWRCHRSLVADAVMIRGWTAHDLLAPGRSQPHYLTPFARVDGDRITYPAPD